MEPTIVWVVAALAVYRLALLVTADEITRPWRDQIIDRYVHRAHEVVAWGTLDEVKLGDRPANIGAGYAFAVCRCGATWIDADDDMGALSAAHGHTNPRQGEMTEGPRWLILLDCVWCASIWIAGPVSWSAWCFGTRAWWFVPAFLLAASGAAGVLATYAKPES